MIHGNARFADLRDVEAMDANEQVGPSGKYLHFGYYRGRAIRLIETLSVTVLAPPGTGKTAHFIIPSLLSTDESCFVVHDPKPELWDICSGYRASLGPCFRLDWSQVDNPEAGIWHPKFNFLDPRVVPPPGPERDTFIDGVAKTLIPKKEGKGDEYFTDKGRGSLVGFIHFLVAQVNDREDPERYDVLPDQWRDMPASLPMLVDWLAETQLAATEKMAASGGQQQDPLKDYMLGLVREAREHHYPPRVIRELQPLILMADRERSGVLGTMDAGLLPFKNEATVERTAESDFVPTDLGGMLSDACLKRLGLDAYPRTTEQWQAIKEHLRASDWEPVTVFVCINQVDASSFEAVTALFFETISKTLLSFGPGEQTRNGIVLGPYPTCYLMDEFAKMAKVDSVMDGPDLGRSKKRYYVLVAQAIAQFERVYSKEQKQTIMSTAAVKFILPQNDPETIKEISSAVGETTFVKTSVSRETGIKSNPLKGNRSESHEKSMLLNTGNLSSMPPRTHYIIVQNYMNRPVHCESSVYYRDPELSRRAWNPRVPAEDNEYQPAPELPDRERGEHEKRHRTKTESRNEEQHLDRLRYWLDPDKMDKTPYLSP